MKRKRKIFLIVLATFGLIQLVPYGRDHQNPPVEQEPEWSSPQVRALAVRACFDCHSHETKWPWYASLAPSSWLVQHDVEDGRRHLNFSLWNQSQRHADECADEVAEEEMPLWYYMLTHPDARLSSREKEELIEGFEKMFNQSVEREAKSQN